MNKPNKQTIISYTISFIFYKLLPSASKSVPLYTPYTNIGKFVVRPLSRKSLFKKRSELVIVLCRVMICTQNAELDADALGEGIQVYMLDTSCE